MVLLPDYYPVTITPQNCLCLVLVSFKLSGLQALKPIKVSVQRLEYSPHKSQCFGLLNGYYKIYIYI